MASNGRSIILTLLILHFVIAYAFCLGELYEVLDIKPDATSKEIKKAFRNKSIMYHPDKVGSDSNLLKKYQEVVSAYEILGNEKLRRMYDEEGEDSILEYKKNLDKERKVEEYSEIYSEFYQGKDNNQHYYGRTDDSADEGFFLNSDIERVNEDNFTRLNSGRWLILIYHTNYEKIRSLVREWKILGSKAYGNFKVGYVSCRSSSMMCKRMGVEETPRIRYYSSSKLIREVSPKEVEKMNWKDFFEIGTFRPLSFVVNVNSGNLFKYLNERPNNFKVLVFSKRANVSIILKLLALKFRTYDFGFIKVNPDSQSIMSQFDVTENELTTFIITDKNAGVYYKSAIAKYDQIFKSLLVFKNRRINEKLGSTLLKVDQAEIGSLKCGKSDPKYCVIVVLNYFSNDVIEQINIVLGSIKKSKDIKYFYKIEPSSSKDNLALKQINVVNGKLKFSDSINAESLSIDILIKAITSRILERGSTRLFFSFQELTK